MCLAIALSISSCGIDLCDNSLRNEVVSADGAVVASLFERNCGATTPYIQVVSLRFLDEKLEPEKFEDWVFTIRGRPIVKVTWEGPDKLSISYSGTGYSPTLKNKWRRVTIIHK